MDLLNIDGRVTRLGKGRPKKGKEYCKRRHSDHLPGFKKNEDSPFGKGVDVRIQEIGLRSTKVKHSLETMGLNTC